ncbi:MAG: hypothetical protein P4L46_10415 [Fimbriimonas sp.]|nr:hypothetical protein [Fimbriimonas sp.]
MGLGIGIAAYLVIRSLTPLIGTSLALCVVVVAVEVGYLAVMHLKTQSMGRKS